MANTQKNRKSRTRSKNKYNKENYDQFLLTVPLGDADYYSAIAEKNGFPSRNAFIVSAVDEYIKTMRRD